MAQAISTKGLLFATAEVGDILSETEWHKWYDEEHVPLRTGLEGFKSAVRYISADDEKPTWAAMYDLDSADVLKSDAYLRLAETRSAREQRVLENVAHFERRVYTLNEAAPTTVSDAFTGFGDGSKPGQATHLLAVSMDVAPEHEAEFHRWYDEEHVPMITKIPGWLRSRRLILVDSSITSLNPKSKEGYKPGPRFLALHDFAHIDGLDGPEHDACRNTPWRTEVMSHVVRYEKRLWKVYKTF